MTLGRGFSCITSNTVASLRPTSNNNNIISGVARGGAQGAGAPPYDLDTRFNYVNII